MATSTRPNESLSDRRIPGRRTRDMIYLVFFSIHIIVMFNVDLYPFYPHNLRPNYMTALREWYITTYHDRFFVSPPSWFELFLWMELLYHVPLSTWAIGAIWRDPKVPIHLLIYAMQTGITTMTCIADFVTWTPTSAPPLQTESQLYASKMDLAKLYVPYLLVSVFMGLDMYTRLVGIVTLSPSSTTASSSTSTLHKHKHKHDSKSVLGKDA